MVYCGKPSKACLPCRKRKLKCDLQHEACGQCRRAHLTCTGYRDTEAIRIRDETATVQRKATTEAIAPLLNIKSPSVSLRYVAKEVFYRDHVVNEERASNFIGRYYCPFGTDEYVVKSIDAVSLAYLNYRNPSEAIQIEARTQYVQALNLLNKILPNQRLATETSTILSIVLLDLYEKVTNPEPQYNGPWAAHIKGAFLLAQLRGTTEYLSSNCTRILERLVTNMMISCLISGATIPQDLITFQSNIITPSHPMSEPVALMVEFGRLISQVKHGRLTDHDIVAAAWSLDKRFIAISKLLPVPEKIVCPLEKSKHHYEGYHHVYPDEHTGQVWNKMRLLRIILSELLYSHCHKVNGIQPNAGECSMEQFAASSINQLSVEICASIPYYFHIASSFCRNNKADASLGKALSEHEVDSAKSDQFLSYYRLIFPLYIAAESPATPQALKTYVIQQLRHIADSQNIKNALTVAQMLEAGKKRDPWSVYALLGSYAFVC